MTQRTVRTRPSSEATLTEQEIDVEYALGAVTNIEGELETQFGKQGITNARLARIEAALRLLTHIGWDSSLLDVHRDAKRVLQQPLSDFHDTPKEG